MLFTGIVSRASMFFRFGVKKNVTLVYKESYIQLNFRRGSIVEDIREYTEQGMTCVNTDIFRRASTT